MKNWILIGCKPKYDEYSMEDLANIFHFFTKTINEIAQKGRSAMIVEEYEKWFKKREQGA